MKFIDLENLQLKTFTESDALDYCQLNNINPLNITELYLSYNELTNISGIKLFKNLEILSLEKNQLTDISVIQNLKNLKLLDINYTKIKNISVLKNLNKLEDLNISNNQITDISVIQHLNNLERLDIVNLELESDQFKYINSLLKILKLYGVLMDLKICQQLKNLIKT